MEGLNVLHQSSYRSKWSSDSLSRPCFWILLIVDFEHFLEALQISMEYSLFIPS